MVEDVEPASATLIFAIVAKEFVDPIVRAATRLIGIVVPATLVKPVLEAMLAIVPVDTPGNGFVASFALDQMAGIANVVTTAQATSR